MPTLIKVETSEWQLEIEGRLTSVPSFIAPPTTSFHIDGTAEVSVLNRASKRLETISSDKPMEPLLFENTQYDFYLNAPSGSVQLRLPPAATFRHRINNITHYELNFRNDVGMSTVEITSGKNQVKITFEVFPTKIDYRADYVQMRDEVAAIARNLAMTVQTRAFGLASPSPTSLRTLTEWLALIRVYFKQLITTTDAIAREPHSKLVESIELVPIERSRRVNDRALNRMLRGRVSRVGAIHPTSGTPLPAKVPEAIRRVTFNTPENQYVKALLLETWRNLQHILQSRATGDEDADLSTEEKFFLSARPEAESMITQLQRTLRLPFLQTTTTGTLKRPSSLVFHRHPHYAALEKTARILNSGLSLGGGLAQIGVKDISLLYEYWCFLRLVSLLRERLDLEQQSIVSLRHTKLTVTLTKGKESRIVFRDPTSGKRLSILYNRQFSNLPTISQRPDNIIQLFSEDKLYIFDAKYRIAVDAQYQRQYNGIGPTTDDINTMHRYRDAIVLPSRATSEIEFIRGVVQCAIVLFPYSDEDAYQNQRFYRSIAQIQIGGLPFLPRATRLAEELIRRLLQEEGYLNS